MIGGSGWRCRATLLLVPVLIALSGCSDRAGQAAEAASLAEAQLEAGNLADARRNIQQAIILRDDVAEYFILLGRVELESGEVSGAFNAYSRALDLQADNIDVLQSIAELGLQTDRIVEADEAATRMLLLFPGSTRAMLVKGFIAIEEGRMDDARKFAKDITDINPLDQGGAILSARVSAIEGRFDEAVRELARARGDAAEAEALDATLLEIYRAQGNATGMRSVFPQVIAATQDRAQYLLDYVNFLYKVGAVQSARGEALKVLANRPNDIVALTGLARLFEEYDPQPLTPGQLETLSSSGTRISQVAIGRFYLEAGQLTNAFKAIQRPFNEDVVEARALASRIMLAQGRSREAEQAAQDVLAFDPRNSDALLTRSAILLAKGETDRALEDANIVVSDAPQEYAGYVALAKAHVAKGSHVRARQVFERGIDALPQSGLLAAEYSSYLRRIGEQGRLVSLHADLVAAAPSSMKAARRYAAVCEVAGSAACRSRAEQAIRSASRSFVIDDAPGTPKDRGLFSRITPEQICRATGGVCTAS